MQTVLILEDKCTYVLNNKVFFIKTDENIRTPKNLTHLITIQNYDIKLCVFNDNIFIIKNELKQEKSNLELAFLKGKPIKGKKPLIKILVPFKTNPEKFISYEIHANQITEVTRIYKDIYFFKTKGGFEIIGILNHN